MVLQFMSMSIILGKNRCVPGHVTKIGCGPGTHTKIGYGPGTHTKIGFEADFME